MERIAIVYNNEQGLAIAGLLQKGGFIPICCDRSIKGNLHVGHKLSIKDPVFVSTIGDALGQTGTVLTVFDNQQDDEDAYMAEGGILEVAEAGSLFVDLSTIGPRSAKDLNALAAVHDHDYVEANIIGAVKPNAKARHRLFVAGEDGSIKKAQPIIDVLSNDTIVTGLPGTANAVRLASTISLAGSLIGLTESLAFASSNGVEKSLMLSLLADSKSPVKGIAGNYGEQIINESFDSDIDVGAFLDELNLALDAAEEAKLPLPALETYQQLFDLLQLIGDDRRGITSIALAYYDEKNSKRFNLDWSLAEKAVDVYEKGSDDDLDEDEQDPQDEWFEDDNSFDQYGYGQFGFDPDPEGDGLGPSTSSYFSDN
ncbi:MAG: NAD-binding protein [Coriobacteriia bacterium]|nr:NAD-binding protein [Coriobacteriia bacterium]